MEDSGSNFFDRIPLPGDPTRTIGQWFRGALTGSPDGDGVLPGVRQLPGDDLSRKHPQTINEHAFPPDERYPGPLSWRNFWILEQQLEAWISILEQAQGKNPSPHLCRVCRRLNLVTGNNFTDQQWIKWRPFGTWAKLACRANCVLCRLIVHAISDGSKRRLHPRLAKIDMAIGTVQLYPESLPCGERYLAVEYGYRRAGAIRIVRPDNLRDVLRQGYEAVGSSMEDLLRDRSSPLFSPWGQSVSISLIRGWLGACEESHGKGCFSLGSSEKQPAIDILLVDVYDRRLVRATSDEKYFALSYVWGNVQMPKTVRSNLNDRLKLRSLPALPATIEDAMMLVKGLNERYLWADVLCIVQDDIQRKHQDIKQMDLVYSQAFATIVGLHGQTAEAGLPGIRPGSRNPQTLETILSPRILPEPDPSFIQQFNDFARTDKEKHEELVACRTMGAPIEEVYSMLSWLRDSIEPGGPGNPILDPSAGSRPPGNPSASGPDFFAMVSHPPSLEYALRVSSWNTRGWTFQERYLSSRCIYFSSDFVYFQCAEGTQCETGGNLLPWPDITPPHKDQRKVVGVEEVETNPLLCLSKNLKVPEEDLTPGGRYKYRRHNFDVYREVAESYSRRQLTFPSDIVNAFAGILSIIGRQFATKVLSGLPGCYLDHALLWSHGESCDRRVSPPTRPGGQQSSSFPSWSWAGWMGSIQYLLVEKGKRTYQRERHEYARSEIALFQVLHHGTLYELSKSSDRMNASETRHMGMLRDQRIDKVFPVYMEYLETKTNHFFGPDLGSNVLHFWAYAVSGEAFTFTAKGGVHTLVDPEHANVPGMQEVTPILDRNRVHCGLCFFPRATTNWHRSATGEPYGLVEWILISSFGDAQDRREGLKTVDGRAHPFDERKLPYKGEGSGLVNAMMIEWDEEVAERITVAQIHRQAWEAASPERKHIRLG